MMKSLNRTSLIWALYLALTEALAILFVIRTDSQKVTALAAASIFILAGARLLPHAKNIRHERHFFAIIGIAMIGAMIGFGLHAADPLAGLARAVAALMVASPVTLAFLPKSDPESEKLASTRVLILDKSGSLAAGVPELKALKSIDPRISELALMQRVASLLQRNDDLLAKTVCSAARSKALELLDVEQFKSSPGEGVSGVVSQRRTVVGSAGYLKAEGIQPGPLEALAINLVREGQLVALVGAEGRAVGIIAVSDPLNPAAIEDVAAAKAQGLKVVLLTADSAEAAKSMADKLGVSEIHGHVTALKKPEIVRQIQAANGESGTVVDGEVKPVLEKISQAKLSVKKTQTGIPAIVLYNIGAVLAAALLPLPMINAVGIMAAFTVAKSWLYRQRITF
jgi:high-affinity K+ transport system ATPase subunit B